MEVIQKGAGNCAVLGQCTVGPKCSFELGNWNLGRTKFPLFDHANIKSGYWSMPGPIFVRFGTSQLDYASLKFEFSIRRNVN